MSAQLLGAKLSVAVKLLVFFITTNSDALIYQQSIDRSNLSVKTPKIILISWLTVAASVVGLIPGVL
jgi:hypothetical protein